MHATMSKILNTFGLLSHFYRHLKVMYIADWE